MDGLTLCFPTYYHCVIKDNTNSFQYDSVSILLLGQKRDLSQEFLTDTMVSNYVNGKKPLPDAILRSLLLCNTSEIENRLKLLDFQGIDYIISSLVTLVKCVSNLSTSEKARLIEIASHPGKEYEFLSITFQNAIRCPTQFICSIDRKLREQIQAIKTTAFSKNNEVTTTTYRNSSEYSSLFDWHCDIIPDIPGRCIVEKNNILCECQTFIAFGNESDIERAKNLEAFIFECNRRDQHIHAFRIPYSSTF